MIQNIWWKVFEMGLAAGWLVMVILILRWVCKRFLPHNIKCLLWLLVAVRLLCPVVPESGLSLMPKWESRTAAAESENRSVAGGGMEKQQKEGQIQADGKETGENDMPQSTADTGLHGNLPDTPRTPEARRAPVSLSLYLHRSEKHIFAGITGWLRQFLPEQTGYIWLVGTVLMAAYGLYGYGHMRYLVRDAVPEPTAKDGGRQDHPMASGEHKAMDKAAGNKRNRAQIWHSDRIRVPFIMGVLFPRIYLPCGLRGQARECVVAHEQMHMRRHDPLIKLTGYLLLAVYWFHPLLWIAYVLLGRDIELACDEKVIRGYGEDTRRKRCYMDTLLTISTQGAIYAGGVLGFGEHHVKGRIRNLLQYRRPAIWTMGISLLLCLLLAVCLLTNPRQGSKAEDDVMGQTEESGKTGPEGIPETESSEQSGGADDPGEGNTADIASGQQAEQSGGADTAVREIAGTEVANVVALPMGDTVKVDLDGDGKEELLQITVTNTGEKAQLNEGDWEFATPVIRVDEQQFIPEEVSFDNLDLCTWYLFRLDGQLQGWQIGLYEDGPSADPCTYLFAYEGGGQFTLLGSFYDCPIQETWPGYCWKRGGEEPVAADGRSYREVLAQVDRSIGSWIQVPGDGSLYARQNMDILQTEKIVGHFQLYGGENARLELTEQEIYKFWNAEDPDQNESAHRTLEDIYVYTEPDTGAERARVSADQPVEFLSYISYHNAEKKWIEFAYNQGKDRGYILADAPYSSILLAPGPDPDDGAEPISRVPGEIFSGLILVP